MRLPPAQGRTRLRQAFHAVRLLRELGVMPHLVSFSSLPSFSFLFLLFFVVVVSFISELLGTGSLLPLWGFRGLNSGLQA